LLCLGAFLGYKLFDDYSHPEQNYRFFIETFLYYQRLFEYSGDINSVLEMPYCLYNDLIVEQVKLKKKEVKDQKIREKAGNRRR
jgi:hypothetical protein